MSSSGSHPGPLIGRSDSGSTSPAVEMQGISKRFGTVQALRSASLTVRRGEVHALLGENGAGKTTLMNVLSGIYLADSGSVSLQGERTKITSPRVAARCGVGMVHQNPELISAFTGYENVALASTESPSLGRFDHGREHLENLAESYGLPVNLRHRVGDLAMGERQKLEILRELYRGATILILDEPTTHLTPGEFDELFVAIRRLAESGLSAILISHKLHEVFAVADQITVLRKGHTVGSSPRSEVTQDDLVSMMLGPASTEEASLVAAGATPTLTTQHEFDRDGSSGSANLLQVSGVSTRIGSGQLKVPALTVNRGEIVGVAGVAGNGQRELVDLLVGTLSADAGSIRLAGLEISALSVAQRIRLGIAILPDDRLNDGALPTAPLWQTYTLGLHQTERDRRWDIASLKRRTQSMIERFGLAASSPDTITADLSGGTLQRALVARSLHILSGAGAGLLIAINPTQGLDVGGIRFVRHHLRELTRRGGGVLLVSEDLDELFELSDRITVLFSHELSGSYLRSDFDRYAIGSDMVGGGSDRVTRA